MTRLIDADVFAKKLEDKWILHEISNDDLTHIGEWLAQVPTVDAVPEGTMKDDVISRQVAIEALENIKQNDPFDRYEIQNIGIDWAIDALKALPSVQHGVRRTNAEWEETED